MKLAVSAILVGSAAAFNTPPLTFAVGKKAPKAAAKAAPKVAAKAAATKAVAAPAKAAPKSPLGGLFAKKAAAPKPVATKAVAAPKAAATPKAAAAPKAAATPKAKAAPKAKPAPVKAAPVKAAPAPKAAATKVVKKVVAKPAPKVVAKAAPVLAAASSTGTVPSTAIPGEVAPALLDGSLVGDVGFDPCFLSTKADLLVNYFKGITGGAGPSNGLTWYREAELMHGRICMVAVVGFIWPGLFGTFSGNEWTGVDAFSYTNALEAFDKTPSASLFQIAAFMSILEFRRINIILKDGESYQAGASQKWGQGGEGFWNPLGLDYTPEEYAEKQLQEIKHGRLAMIAFVGLVLQGQASGVGVIEQLSGAFEIPEYATKAGYFLPEGI